MSSFSMIAPFDSTPLAALVNKVSVLKLSLGLAFTTTILLPITFLLLNCNVS